MGTTYKGRVLSRSIKRGEDKKGNNSEGGKSPIKEDDSRDDFSQSGGLIGRLNQFFDG